MVQKIAQAAVLMTPQKPRAAAPASTMCLTASNSREFRCLLGLARFIWKLIAVGDFPQLLGSECLWWPSDFEDSTEHQVGPRIQHKIRADSREGRIRICAFPNPFHGRIRCGRLNVAVDMQVRRSQLNVATACVRSFNMSPSPSLRPFCSTLRSSRSLQPYSRGHGTLQ
jgi:hypothetical protein